MIPNADGPDISRHNPVGNWDEIPQYRLFVTKATGTSTIADRTHVDPTFHENWRQMRRRNFEFRGCYHWLRPDIPMADQVRILHETLAVHGGLQAGEFVMLDWERTPGLNIPTVEQVEEWLTLASQHWAGRLAVYSAEWVTGFIDWRSRNPGFPLFYANYNLTDPTRNGWIKTTQYRAAVWQWTSSHPIPGVNDETCDMNHVLDWSVLQKITTAPKVDVLYPSGYKFEMITMAEMRRRHEPKMHPEFARRLFAWIEAQNGLIGIGNGWRLTQPVKPGAAPDGKSFHQYQNFSSGIKAYAAVDIVTVDGPDDNVFNDTVSWAMSESAPKYGLHTFVTNEPWHVQPIEIRGWTSWINAGRPDPMAFPLPGQTPLPPPPAKPPVKKVVDMVILDLNPGTAWWVAMLLHGNQITHLTDGNHVAVMERGGVPRVKVVESEVFGILRSVRATNDSPFAPALPSYNQVLHEAWLSSK